jgi:phage gp29-like protein
MSAPKKRIANRAAQTPAKSNPAGGTNMVRKVAALNRWREQYNPLQGLTLQRAIALSREYFLGQMADLQWAYFFIEQTDADLLALIERRNSRILEMDWQIKLIEGADEKLATAQADLLRERYDAIDNLTDAIEHLAMAAFRGYAHLEKWRGDDGQINHLEVVDQWNVIRDGLRGDWKYNPDARATLFTGLPEANLMPPEQFVFREVRRPINRIAFFKFVRANLSDKDWDAFVEIYGIPGGVTIGPPNVPADREAEFAGAAKDISEGGSGFLPNGSQYVPNTGPRGSQPFKERLDHLSEKLILAGTGGLLTMLAAPVGLSGGGQSKAHADVFEQIAKAEAKRIGDVFGRALSAAWLEESFPGQKVGAYFAIAANVETDVGEICNHVKLLADAGYQVDPDQVSEETGYTVQLKAPPAPPAGAPGLTAPAAPGATIANRGSAVSAGRAALFGAHAKQQITTAQLAVVRPLLDRLAALDNCTDVEFPAALAKLKADLPGMYAEAMKRAPEAAAAWEAVLGTALVDGFGAAAEAQKGAEQPRSIAQRASNRAKRPCKARAMPSKTR